MPMTGAEEPLRGGEESPGADKEAEPPEGPVELVEEGGKGLKEVTPFPEGIEFELATVGGVMELGITTVPRGTKGDVTPIGRRIFELITVGRGLGLTSVPR